MLKHSELREVARPGAEWSEARQLAHHQIFRLVQKNSLLWNNKVNRVTLKITLSSLRSEVWFFLVVRNFNLSNVFHLFVLDPFNYLFYQAVTMLVIWVCTVQCQNKILRNRIDPNKIITRTMTTKMSNIISN